MTLAILHTHDFRDYALLERELQRLCQHLPAITEIIAIGWPRSTPLAAHYAQAQNLPVQLIAPNYRRFKRTARKVLNGLVLTKAEALVAFWDGTSSNMGHALDLARRKHLRYVIPVSVTCSWAVNEATPRP